MTCIPGLGQPKSIKKLQATRFKVEENSRTFQGLTQEFKDFPSKSEIQGLFENVRTAELQQRTKIRPRSQVKRTLTYVERVFTTDQELHLGSKQTTRITCWK